MAISPDWVLQTAPQYFLGECIVALRCAEDPLPPIPKPSVELPTPSLPLRLCLISPSDLAREKISGKLREIYGVEIIRVEDLVHQATKRGAELSRVSARLDTDTNAAYIPPTQPTDSGSYDVDDEFDRLCLSVYDSLKRGEVISDELYVKLAFEKIASLSLPLDYKVKLAEKVAAAAAETKLDQERTIFNPPESVQADSATEEVANEAADSAGGITDAGQSEQEAVGSTTPAAVASAADLGQVEPLSMPSTAQIPEEASVQSLGSVGSKSQNQLIVSIDDAQSDDQGFKEEFIEPGPPQGRYFKSIHSPNSFINIPF